VLQATKLFRRRVGHAPISEDRTLKELAAMLSRACMERLLRHSDENGIFPGMEPVFMRAADGLTRVRPMWKERRRIMLLTRPTARS